MTLASSGHIQEKELRRKEQKKMTTTTTTITTTTTTTIPFIPFRKLPVAVRLKKFCVFIFVAVFARFRHLLLSSRSTNRN
jgi:uncharacterized membrane protein